MLSSRASTICLRTAGQRRALHATLGLADAETPRLPKVANPSFWASLIPSFLRRPATAEQAAQRARVRDAASEERRTGLIFLFLGILVGSNAINIIAIRRDMLNFTRQTEAKLALLREVVQKVKNGQDVDVKAALGTGDPEQEQEWERMIQELEDTDMLAEGRKKREAKRAQKAEERRVREEEALRQSKASEPKSSSTAKSTPKFLM